jgi:hypothetical protein
LRKLTCDLLSLFHKHAHRQTPDQPPRPLIIRAMKSMESPCGHDAFRLAQSSRYPDHAVATGRLRGQITLPWARGLMSREAAEPLIEGVLKQLCDSHGSPFPATWSRKVNLDGFWSKRID